MPEFTYRAGDQRGTLTAGSPREARDRLRERGLSASEVKEVPGRRGTPRGGAGRFGGRRGFDLAEVARELATLLSVGVPVLEAIETLAAGRAPGPAGVLGTLARRLRRGVPLADAMRDPAVARHFDPLSVLLVEVGEQAGNLDEALDRVAEFRERRAQLRGKIGATLAYPLFVGVVALLVSVFLMTRVVPGVLAPLVAQGRPLPAVTVAVKAVSDTLLDQGGWILLGLLTAGALAALAWRRPAVRRAASEASLRAPVLGPLLRQRGAVPPVRGDRHAAAGGHRLRRGVRPGRPQLPAAGGRGGAGLGPGGGGRRQRHRRGPRSDRPLPADGRPRLRGGPAVRPPGPGARPPRGQTWTRRRSGAPPGWGRRWSRRSSWRWRPWWGSSRTRR